MSEHVRQTTVITSGVLEEKARALLKAAAEYREAFNRVCFSGAVVWLEDDEGRLLVFTRGEYAEQIKRVINENLSPPFYFQEKEQQKS